MGKWTSLRGKFPQKSAGDSTFVEKVNAEKELRSAIPLNELMEEHERLNAEKDELEDKIKTLNVGLEALSQLLVARFDDLGVSSLKTQSGRTMYQQIEPEPSVADPVALERYIAENDDLEYLYKVNHQSLKSLVKSMLEEGKDAEVEAMGVAVFLREKIGSRKS